MKRHPSSSPRPPRIRSPNRPGKPSPCSTAKPSHNWEGDAKIWRVEDGALTGGSLAETVKQNDFASTKEYANFIVASKSSHGQKVHQFRIPNSQPACRLERDDGYQCDFGDPTWWGAIYDESRRNKVLSPSI
jgi:hypothetical protein